MLYDFEANLPAARYAELKAEYGMGKYGLNASGSGDTEDVTGYNPHGTHVAGIVAAQWNGFGMSGVANGTKIFALRTFGNNGESQNEASLLKGFQFLVDVAQDVNLKAVNCSWGSGFTQFSYEVMVNELGKKGVNASAFDSVYECQWAHVSFDIAGNIGASNEAHDIIAAGGTIGGETEAGGLEYDDPGEVTAVYGWNDGGKTYIIAKMGLSGDPTGIRPASGTTFYIDDVAVGDANAYVAAYANMSGTSMAAPSVTGCLAVIAKDEPDTATLSDEQLSQLALERAAKLLATVDYDDDLAGLCRTGGRVNLHGQTAYAAKAPLITSAVADGDALAI